MELLIPEGNKHVQWNAPSEKGGFLCLHMNLLIRHNDSRLELEGDCKNQIHEVIVNVFRVGTRNGVVSWVQITLQLCCNLRR